MSDTAEKVSATGETEKSTAPKEKSKGKPKPPSGGKGAREKRAEGRRNFKAATTTNAIHAQTLASLQPPVSLTWRPLVGKRPGCAGVSLDGIPAFFRSFWRRMLSIAARPLAIAMGVQYAEARYLKCLLYLAFVRVSCAQDNSQLSNSETALQNRITEMERRLATTKSRVIPRAVAWILQQYGLVKVDEQEVTPLLFFAEPIVTRDNVTTYADPGPGINPIAINALVTHYAALTPLDHDPVPAGAPADQQPHRYEHHSRLATYAGVLRDFHFTLTQAGRPANVTTNVWNDLGRVDWEVFTSVNAAAAAQDLCVTAFEVTNAVGGLSQVVRFLELGDVYATSQLYSIVSLDDATLVDALALRPAIDSAMPAFVYDRFRSTPNTALTMGFDSPATAIDVLLTTLVTRLRT